MRFSVEFQAVKFNQGEKSTNVRENDKDVREIKIHLPQVLRVIEPFDFATVFTSNRGFIQQTNLCGGESPENTYSEMVRAVDIGASRQNLCFTDRNYDKGISR